MAGIGVAGLDTILILIDAVKTIENKWECCDLDQPAWLVTREMNGGSGGARTRNLCRDRAAL